MSSFAFFPADSWLPLIAGSAVMLYAAAMAVIQRKEPKRLILWGALHDLGVCILGLAAQSAIGLAGIIMYLIFQLSARLLSWSALERLVRASVGEPESAGEKAGFLSRVLKKGAARDDLAGSSAPLPWTSAFFAFGLLASAGGSAFLLPEGRAFIMSGILSAPDQGSFLSLMIMSGAATVFIWLYVETVQIICLEKPSPSKRLKDAAFAARPGALVWTLGAITAALGLFRTPFTDLCALPFGIEAAHSPAGAAFWILYAGAFVTGALYLWRVRTAPVIGTAFFALAFAAVCAGTAGPLAYLFLFIITLIGLVVAVYSISYIHDGPKGWYWFFLLLTFASLAGIVQASNTAAMFGYWELMTFASYFLIVYDQTPKAFAAGLKYYVMCAGGALFMLPGLMALGAYAADPALALQLPFWLKAGLLLCLIGFGVKAGIVPFQSWLPDAHPAAPSSVSAPLSGVITKMGVFGVISVIFISLGSAQADISGLYGLSWLETWLVIMGAATLIYGEAMALMQTDIKRMLAFSTIGQVGEVFLVLGLGTWLATCGALWHALNHAVMKDLLFLGAGAMILRAGSRELSDLRGIGHKMPLTAACMGVGLISIMGLPPFGGFYSKFLMIQASVNAGHVWAAVLLLLGALAGAIYYTRILKTIILESPPAGAPEICEAPYSMRLAMVILAALSLLFGLAPQLLIPLIVPAASLAFPIPENVPAILAAISVNWPVYALFPVLGAVLPGFFPSRPRMAGWMSVGVLLVTALLVLIFGQDLDTLSFSFALLVPIVGAINMTYAVGYMAHSRSQWRFYCAFTCMCGGLIGMAASQYLLSFFLFWEIMSSWALYMAIAQEGTEDALREAFKYFFFNLFGAGFLFIGLAVTGPLMPFNSSLLEGLAEGMSPAAAWWGMALLAMGFVLKAAQLPFRIDWQMHPALAPTPVSGYISSVLLKSAIIGLIKLFMLLGAGFLVSRVLGIFSERLIMICVMWIGGITIIMAAIQALRANGLKLVFIYSTVSQLGYMVLAAACGGALGWAGSMLHLVNHMFFKDLLFLVCGAVMFTTGRETLHELGGIGRKMPFTLLMFAIGGLSLVGIPPTSGFSSKWIIYQGLMEAGQPLLALLSLVGSVITLAYVAKFLHAAFLGQPGSDLDGLKEAPLVMRFAMGLLALGCVLTGIFPGLALYPINNILAQYGSPTLQVGLSGILTGAGAWNATAVFIMMAAAFLGGGWFARHFTRLREIDVHTCGLPPQTAASRMSPTSIYGDIMRLLSGGKTAGRS